LFSLPNVVGALVPTVTAALEDAIDTFKPVKKPAFAHMASHY
jgi:hypothetical protein